MSGVEAVYVDDTRINSLVNGKGTVALKDYAGDGKEVTVYAVDYSGNRSKEVKLDNPYYEEPAQTQAASSAAPQSSSGGTQTAPSTTPAPSPSANNASSSSSNSESSQAAGTPSTSQAETEASSESPAAEDETESAVPEGAFTPEGTGTVLDLSLIHILIRGGGVFSGGLPRACEGGDAGRFQGVLHALHSAHPPLRIPWSASDNGA